MKKLMTTGIWWMVQVTSANVGWTFGEVEHPIRSFLRMRIQYNTALLRNLFQGPILEAHAKAQWETFKGMVEERNGVPSIPTLFGHSLVSFLYHFAKAESWEEAKKIQLEEAGILAKRIALELQDILGIEDPWPTDEQDPFNPLPHFRSIAITPTARSMKDSYPLQRPK